jgi:hypothetical protein
VTNANFKNRCCSPLRYGVLVLAAKAVKHKVLVKLGLARKVIKEKAKGIRFI